MSLSKRKPGRILPTPAELRILRVLWEESKGTVEDVVRRLSATGPANYKTIQTLLRIMEQKKLVRHLHQGRAFIFEPCVSREEVARLSVRNLLEQSFGGSPAQLLVNLLEDGQIDESELSELEDLIRRYRSQRRTASSNSG